MNKIMFLLAIAVSLMLGSCSKKDLEVPVNEVQIEDVKCKDCDIVYRVKGMTWSSPKSDSKFTSYSGGTEQYSVHTIVDGQEDQDLPFSLSENGQNIKWNCVNCGGEVKFTFKQAVLVTVSADGPMPQTREHILQ